MSSKRKRLSKRASNSPLSKEYKHNMFITLEVSKRYTMIARNRTFIKEKGFEHTENFFGKDIENKGWKELCKPATPIVISIVREFYANLADQALKRVWVSGKWVPFDSETINNFYNLPNVDNEAYEKLSNEPNYKEIIKCLTNDQERWKINCESQVVNFKAKGLLYIPKVWHHFITSRILPTTMYVKSPGKESS